MPVPIDNPSEAPLSDGTGTGSVGVRQYADTLAATPKAGLFLLAILLAIYLPGLWTLPTVDRDEARFAQASRQMYESATLPEPDRAPFELNQSTGVLTAGKHAGGLVVPMVGNTPRLSKPPLIYWAQTLSLASTSWIDARAEAIWRYRAPSLIAAIAACLFTWRLGIAMGNARAAWLAAVLLGSCPMVVWDANQARADQLLLACTTAALAAMYPLWRAAGNPLPRVRSWLLPACFWSACALGILTKGPITPMIAATTAITASVLARNWRWIPRTRPALGLCILAGFIAPWLIAAAHAVGTDTLLRVYTDETLARSISAKEGHWAPPGYHLILLAVLFWPGSLLIANVLRRHLAERFRPTPEQRERNTAQPTSPTTFLIAWIVPAWMIFEAVGTKLPHYTMPLYPPIALLTARTIVDLADGLFVPHKPIPTRTQTAIWAAIGIVLTAAFPVFVSFLGASNTVRVIAVMTAIACAVCIVAAARSALRARILRAHAQAVAATLVFAFGFMGFVLPRTTDLWITSRLTAAIATLPQNTPIAAVAYHEDSLTFATNARLERIAIENVPAWTAEHPAGVLILPASAPPPPGWSTIARVAGLNYSNGRRVDLAVLAAPKQPD